MAEPALARAASKPASRPGVLTISLDFELYWGTRDGRTLKSYGENILGGRRAIPRMLELFTELGIHATWATVGFVCLNGKDELARHRPARTPEYAERQLDPYGEFDGIGQGERTEAFFFAPELVELIQKTPGQELGSHTFSHYYCLEKGQTPEAFSADLAAMRSVTREKFGREAQSLVFPRNQFNAEYLALCRQAGIRAYRGNPRSWIYEPRNGEDETKLRRAIRLLDSYVNLTGHHGHRLEELPPGDPVDVPASRFLRPFARRLKALEPLRLRRIERDLTHSAEHGLLYHLWWHPDNFGTHTDENLRGLRQVLEHFRSLAGTHGMQSLNMGEVANLLRPRAQA